MRRLLVILAVLAIATTALAGRSIDGSIVTLVEPTLPLTEMGLFTFTFFVENGSSDGESILGLACDFPSSCVPQEETGSWAPGPQWLNSTGTWDIWVDKPGSHCWAYWAFGELLPQENCFFSMDVYFGFDKGVERTAITWYLFGVDESDLSGTIDMNPVPVESETWSAIKALYR